MFSHVTYLTNNLHLVDWEGKALPFFSSWRLLIASAYNYLRIQQTILIGVTNDHHKTVRNILLFVYPDICSSILNVNGSRIWFQFFCFFGGVVVCVWYHWLFLSCCCRIYWCLAIYSCNFAHFISQSSYHLSSLDNGIPATYPSLFLLVMIFNFFLFSGVYALQERTWKMF
jgi:hypothetical protein